MESKVNYTAVGLFVIVLAAALAGMAWWLAVGGHRQATAPYLIYATDNVNGLRTDSSVLYRGVAVGKVQSIGIDPENATLIRIAVQIDRDVPVRADTVAQLSPLGVTGLSAVNLSGGASPEPLRPPAGETVPVIPYKPSLFTQIEGGLNSAAVTLTRIGERVDSLLSPTNVESIATTLKNLQSLSQTLADNQHNIDLMFANAQTASDRLAGTAAGADKLVGQTRELIGHVDRLTAELGGVMPQLAQAASSVRVAGNSAAAFSNAGTAAMTDMRQRTLPQIDALARSLQQLSQELDGLTQRLAANPGQLLYGPTLPPPGPGESR